MTDHLATPPLVYEDLIAAFDASWLAGAALGHGGDGDDDVVLDCGTAASNAMIELCNAAELADGGSLSPYLRVGAAPRDGSMAGQRWHAVLNETIEEGVRQWRKRAGPLAGAGSAFFRQHDSAFLVATMRRWRDELAIPPKSDDAPLPVLNAVSIAPMEPPISKSVLAATPTAEDLRAGLLERWGTARSLASLPQNRTGERLRGALPDRLSRARVAGAASAPLRAPAVSPPAAAGAAGDAAASPDIVYHVFVYHQGLARRDQEFLVLGSHTLDTLRDRIYCRTDVAEADQHHNASYLYCEGVLYDDRRPGRHVRPLATPAASPEPAAAAGAAGPRFLSDEVVAWSLSALREGRSTGWGLLRGGSMAATRFDALRPSLGAHYVYCHQGSCQHIIVFADARLLSPLPGYDLLDSAFYPRHLAQAAIRRRLCSACVRVSARHASFGDALTADTPAFLCDACLDMLHCDASGRAVYAEGATVIPYLHD